jgi:hypothetical protein
MKTAILVAIIFGAATTSALACNWQCSRAAQAKCYPQCCNLPPACFGSPPPPQLFPKNPRLLPNPGPHPGPIRVR